MAPTQKPLVSIISMQHNLRVPRKKIAELIAFIAKSEAVRIAEIDVAVVTSKEIARLNREYLSHAGETDVISFDLSDGPKADINGQLVLCAEVATKQAKKMGVGVQRELLLYVAHGLLHLMGYDDTTAGEAAKMHARQEQLLEKFFKKRS